MKIISLILARGGSKGIPKKNIRLLKGRPLISYSIGESLRSDVQETWVCTDDAEIEKVSVEYGAKVLKRPSYLATDSSKSEESLLFFAENVDYDLMVFIQPTSPLIKEKYINQGLKMVLSGGYDSVFSVYEEHWIPRWNKDGTADNWDIHNRPMRQDMPKKYVENGAFYITSKELLLKNKNRYSGNIGLVEMSCSESFQVDTFDDILIMEKLLS